MAVILVNFSDQTIDDVPAVKEKLVDLFIENPDSVAKYHAAQSHGQRTMTLAGGKVHGPITVDVASKCDMKPLTAKAEAALEGIPYDDLAVIFPGAKADCAWGGLAEVPGKRSWYPVEHIGASTLAHELGHNLGFSHQGRDICPPGVVTGCRTGDGHSKRTPMGGGGSKTGYSAPELTKVKWLAADKVVTPAATANVELVALHAPGSVRGTRAVDLPLPGGDRLMVEYRVPGMGVDVGITQGVNVYRVPAGKYGSARIIDGSPQTTAEADNSVPVGSSLVANDISVTVVAAGATSAEVRIGIGPDAVAAPAKPSAPAKTTTSARPSSTSATSSTTSAPPSETVSEDDMIVMDPALAAAVPPEEDSQSPAYLVIAGAFVALLLGTLLVRRSRV
ncbi:Gametolysin peptidase M11 [Actinokineospora alba]|uniref:Gametolysin peptidase M11 n=2 Tax=Actinokineospora alba TaxID=504798 RepID=A0A1H0FDU5_9PSEU|nr:gametolysin peptidase M11 [Actinokineospora alba]SDI16753.1 Gametolysin peptidase M11 [Actinokineospora alba]SDN92820.1 Gametolysin peptidase M11 [Actinokineospora alba]